MMCTSHGVWVLGFSSSDGCVISSLLSLPFGKADWSVLAELWGFVTVSAAWSMMHPCFARMGVQRITSTWSSFLATNCTNKKVLSRRLKKWRYECLCITPCHHPIPCLLWLHAKSGSNCYAKGVTWQCLTFIHQRHWILQPNASNFAVDRQELLR